MEKENGVRSGTRYWPEKKRKWPEKEAEAEQRRLGKMGSRWAEKAKWKMGILDLGSKVVVETTEWVALMVEVSLVGRKAGGVFFAVKRQSFGCWNKMLREKTTTSRRREWALFASWDLTLSFPSLRNGVLLGRVGVAVTVNDLVGTVDCQMKRERERDVKSKRLNLRGGERERVCEM